MHIVERLLCHGLLTTISPHALTCIVLSIILLNMQQRPRKRRHLIDLIKQVLPNVNSRSPMISMATKIINNLIGERDWSAQEICHMLLGLDLTEGSRTVIDVNLYPENERQTLYIQEIHKKWSPVYTTVSREDRDPNGRGGQCVFARWDPLWHPKETGLRLITSFSVYWRRRSHAKGLGRRSWMKHHGRNPQRACGSWWQLPRRKMLSVCGRQGPQRRRLYKTALWPYKWRNVALKGPDIGP